jgi:hypothetical protein
VSWSASSGDRCVDIADVETGRSFRILLKDITSHRSRHVGFPMGPLLLGAAGGAHSREHA